MNPETTSPDPETLLLAQQLQQYPQLQASVARMLQIVENQRGGYCYELNGLFNELLKDLGYRTHLVSGRVYGGERGYQYFAHQS